MKFIAIAAILGSASADLCCKTCPDNLIKTWSIDKIHNECGEGCIKESMFNIYKIFEAGLVKAESNTTPECANRGYTLYDTTATHGIPHILSVTVDLYKT